MNLSQEKLGKWNATVDALRMIRKLEAMLEGGEELTSAVTIEISNVYNVLLASCPKKVRDELLHG